MGHVSPAPRHSDIHVPSCGWSWMTGTSFRGQWGALLGEIGIETAEHPNPNKLHSRNSLLPVTTEMLEDPFTK